MGWTRARRGTAQAEGVVDQAREGVPDGQSGTLQILALAPIGQEFTPSRETLVVVEVWLGTMNPSGDADVVLQVRETSISGPILGSAAQIVPYGFGGWRHFDLSPPVSLTSGAKYVIELASTTNTFGWTWNPDAPGYPGGQAITLRNSVSNYDFLFRTYAPPDTPPVGGVAELPDVAATGDPLPRNPIIVAAVTALVAFGAGAWYARRRWVR